MKTLLQLILALIACAISGSAGANDTVSLSAIADLYYQDPNLAEEIRNILDRTGTTTDDIQCSGTPLGAEFGSLSGSIVAPITCSFDAIGKNLVLQANVSVVINQKKFNVDSQRDTIIEALSAEPNANVFMYQVLTKSRWQRR